VLKSLEHYVRTHRLLRPGERVGVAVSGGADSVALLRGLAALAPSLGVVLFVLHLNHNLRGPESEADEEFVRALASQLDLDAAIETEDVASLAALLHLSLEAAGRRARYAFFHRAASAHGLDCVATAHTRDDQAETVLLRLFRGTGTSGLAGIHRGYHLTELTGDSVSPEPAGDESPLPRTRLIRPLLSTSRQQVEGYLLSMGQPFRQDSSNLSLQFLRNRVRGEVLPMLERDYNPRLRQALCETAEIAAAENEFIEDLVSTLLGSEPEQGIEIPLLQAQPLALQRRILRRLCRPHGLALDFAHLESLREFALVGSVDRLKLPRGFVAEIVRERLCPSRLILRSPRQTQAVGEEYSMELSVPGSVSLGSFLGLPNMCIQAVLLGSDSSERAYNRAHLLSSSRVGRRLTIRNLLPGDRYRPLHSSGERKINRLLQERSIPSMFRRSWPVVLADERIVWVPGLAVAEEVAWLTGDGEAIALEMHSGESAGFYGPAVCR
jgi:tRNA(Ile)-lysidine synthetase-like protein